jgi:putative membrane protein
MEEETNTQELARRRTEWADERTRMAGERTYFAWLRTGLALVAAGLATARLLSSLEPQWLVRTMGVIFIMLGVSIFALGFRTYYEVARELKEEGVSATSYWFIGILTLLLIVAAMGALILVFV